jgi:hypothetical protein
MDSVTSVNEPRGQDLSCRGWHIWQLAQLISWQRSGDVHQEAHVPVRVLVHWPEHMNWQSAHLIWLQLRPLEQNSVSHVVSVAVAVAAKEDSDSDASDTSDNTGSTIIVFILAILYCTTVLHAKYIRLSASLDGKTVQY